MPNKILQWSQAKPQSSLYVKISSECGDAYTICDDLIAAVNDYKSTYDPGLYHTATLVINGQIQDYISF